MAKIIIKGETAEAHVRMTEAGDGYTYDCSRGVWCGLPIDERESLADVMNQAEWHVDRHDGEHSDHTPEDEARARA